MRIAIDIRELLAPQMTGIGRFVSNLIDGLAGEPSTHGFLLYATEKPRDLPEAAHLRFASLAGNSSVWWDQVRLPRRLAQDRVDVFLSPYDKAPIRCPCPYVTTFHDATYTWMSEFTGTKRLVYNALVVPHRRQVARSAAGVITVSSYAREAIVRALGVPREKTHIVPNAVGRQYRPRPERESASVAAAYGIELPYLLHVGNWKPHKNIPGLLKAYASLPADLRNENRLVLCGPPGRFEVAIRGRIEELGLKGSVIAVGAVPESRLPALYSGARLFVFPSSYEGFGLPVIEAMACGTPVIASNNTALPEVVGDAGVLVDWRSTPALRDAIERLVTNASLRESYAGRGLDRARLFSVERSAAKVIQALENASGKGPWVSPTRR